MEINMPEMTCLAGEKRLSWDQKVSPLDNVVLLDDL